MIRRFNFTKRSRIPQKLVRMLTTDSPVRELVDVSWELEEFNFPDESAIFIEAYLPGAIETKRIPWGSVSSPARADSESRALPGISGQRTSFNFKVVDLRSNIGRILGIARNVVPMGHGDDASDERRSLLPVHPVDLGDEVWRLDFSRDRAHLMVNIRIPGVMELVRRDPGFLSLVFPSIVRQLLFRILVIEDVHEVNAHSDDWREQWLAWGTALHPEQSPPPENYFNEMIDITTEWIDEVAASFASHHQAIELFQAALEGNDA